MCVVWQIQFVFQIWKMKKHGFEISKIIEGSYGTLANMSLKIEAHRSYTFQHKRYLASAFSPYVHSDL